MEIYTFFEGDLTGIGSYLGSFSKLDKGLDMARSYFECAYFEVADKIANTAEIDELLNSDKNVIVTSNLGNHIYIFKSDLDKQARPII